MVKKSEQRNPQKGDIVIATPYREDFKKEFEGTVTGFRIEFFGGDTLYSVVNSKGKEFECYGFQLKIKE